MSDPRMQHSVQATGLADILERVLDKGVVIAGDITISLVQVELLNIKLRLLLASVDKAMEMGINWWESDPTLSSRAHQLEEENRTLRDRLDRLESRLEAGT
ncbi:MAG: gas vesicle protein [Ardenticatenaceae bacterium]|nr:gas vesicle protein [Ardenticatenaceae bacterium]